MNWALLWAIFAGGELLAFLILLYIGRPTRIQLKSRRQ
jgi:hypothetical protein